MCITKLSVPFIYTPRAASGASRALPLWLAHCSTYPVHTDALACCSGLPGIEVNARMCLTKFNIPRRRQPDNRGGGSGHSFYFAALFLRLSAWASSSQFFNSGVQLGDRHRAAVTAWRDWNEKQEGVPKKPHDFRPHMHKIAASCDCLRHYYKGATLWRPVSPCVLMCLAFFFFSYSSRF